METIYIFVEHKNQVWYKIDSLNRFTNFKEHLERIWQETYDKIRLGRTNPDHRLLCIAYEDAKNKRISPMEALYAIEEDTLYMQKRLLRKFRTIYINKNGQCKVKLSENHTVDLKNFSYEEAEARLIG